MLVQLAGERRSFSGRGRHPPHKRAHKPDAHRHDRQMAALYDQIRPERAADQRERPRSRLTTLPGDAAPPHS